MSPTLTARLGKVYFRSHVFTIRRKVTTIGTALSLEKRRIKKLVLVLAITTPITDTTKKTTLERVPCIQYLVQFYRKKDKYKNKNIRPQIYSGIEVNAIHLACDTKLSFRARKINVDIHKIDRSYLDNF